MPTNEQGLSLPKAAQPPGPRKGTYVREGTSEDNPIVDHELHPETVVWVTRVTRDITVRAVVEPLTDDDQEYLIALDIASPAHRRVEQIMRVIGDHAWACVCEGEGCGHVWISLTEQNPGMLTMIGLKVLHQVGLISKARGNRILTEPSFTRLMNEWGRPES
jgi:hypothetical protein